MKLNNFFNEKLTRAPADGTGALSADGTPLVEVPDLSFIPGDFHVDGKPDLAKFTAHYQDIVARDAQAAERLAQVPESYDFALSPDLKFDGLDLPEGFSVNLAKDDPAMAPLYGELGSFLKEVGAPASAASRVADLIAKYEAVKFSQAYAASNAEMQALGTPSQQDARIASVERVLASRLPEAQANALKGAVRSAAGIMALEALLKPAGPTTPPTQPRTPDLESMTPMERLKYANAQRT